MFSGAHLEKLRHKRNKKQKKNHSNTFSLDNKQILTILMLVSICVMKQRHKQRVSRFIQKAVDSANSPPALGKMNTRQNFRNKHDI